MKVSYVSAEERAVERAVECQTHGGERHFYVGMPHEPDDRCVRCQLPWDHSIHLPVAGSAS